GFVLRGEHERRDGPLARRVKPLVEGGIAAWLARPSRAWIAAAVLAAATLACVPQIGGRSLLPPLRDRDLLLELRTIPGPSLPERNGVTAAASGELRALPGVRGVGARVGRAIGSDRLVNVNSAEMWITLDGTAGYGRTIAAIKATMREYPGVTSQLAEYPAIRIAQVTSGQANDLVVRVCGPSLDVLQRKAHDVRKMLTEIPGVTQVV